jgi:hypothetical protein
MLHEVRHPQPHACFYPPCQARRVVPRTRIRTKGLDGGV